MNPSWSGSTDERQVQSAAATGRVTASSEFLSLIAQASRFARVKLADVFAGAGITHGTLEQPGERVPIEQARTAWQTLEQLADEPLLGLKLSAQLEPGALDLLDYLVQSAGTLREACLAFCRYAPLMTDAGSIWLAEDREYARLHHHAEGALPNVSELIVGGIVQRARSICGPSLAIRGIGFMHAARAPVAEYTELLGVTPTFEQPCDTVSFDRSALDAPTLKADPRLSEILRKQADLRVERLSSAAQDELQGVRATTLELVLSGHVGIARLAERLGTTPRTLQRRFANHGLTHRELVDSVRAELVEHALRRRAQSWAELSRALGYASGSSLRRAHKRWSKTQPRRGNG
jgi:AraC-like DNA-binding protein